MVCARRAVCEPLRQRTVDSTAYVCSVFKTLLKYAVESIVRRRSGSQAAHFAYTMRTPFRVFAWTARACDLRAAVAADGRGHCMDC
eukprot:246296-Lingulodinium_polyedra.AAC.1